MKKLSFFLAVTVCISGFGQPTKPKNKWDNTFNVYIDIENHRSYKTVEVKEDGQLVLDKLPEKLSIAFPGEDFKKISLTFNKDKKDSFVVSLNCSQGANCEELKWSDFEAGKVDIFFHKGELIRIGKRNISPRKINEKEVFIKVIEIVKKDESIKPMAGNFPTTTKLQRLLPFIPSTKLDSIIQCILCGNEIPLCPDSIDCDEKKIPTARKKTEDPKKQENSKKDKKKKLSRSENRKLINLTKGITYVVKYDENGSERWYARDPQGGFTEVQDISKIRPMANSLIYAEITGSDTTEFTLGVDNVEESFTEGAANPFGDGKIDSTEKKETTSVTPTSPEITHAKAMAEHIEALRQLGISNPTMFPVFNALDSVEQAQSIDSIVKGVDLSKRTLFLNQINIVGLNVQKLLNELKMLTNSAVDNKYTSNEVEWKARLIALDIVLEWFNWKYSSIDFKKSQFLEDRLNIQLGIKKCFNIGIFQSPDSFKNQLVDFIKYEVDSTYYSEMGWYIKAIAEQYSLFLAERKSTRVVKYKNVQVPDADRFNVYLKSNKKTGKLFDETFHIRGGFKIDFSSGIFFTGLGNSEFILANSVFKYRESRDTVIVVSGIPKDSIIYTGRVNEANGNLIRKNRNRFNYGAGFFAHGYWRSGKPINAGMIIGAAINNNGTVLGMVGASIMFAGKNQRIALLGGVCMGKKKKLSSSAQTFVWKKEYEAFENGQQIYENIRQVPRFFDNSNSTEVPTYERLKPSYFFGLSFNLGTITPG